MYKIMMPSLAMMKRSVSSSKRKAKWVSRGIISACECFSCANKVDHRFKESRVSILCNDPCRYKLLKGEVRPALIEIADLERA